MFSLIKQVFIVLLSIKKSLVTKCMPSNDEQCMVRPTFIDVNPVELKYYPFMIGLNKCNGSCNVCNINVKVFNMITKKMKLKQ